MNYQTERWLPVVGHEGLYEVSDLGRVRSLPRPGRRGSMLATTAGRHGHLRVELWKEGRRARPFVHRLVLEAFVGPCPEGHECRHFPDPDPANNRPSNLQWGTRAENVADAVAHGTTGRGELGHNAKLTEAKVVALRYLYRRGADCDSLGRIFGVTKETARLVATGKAWSWVPGAPGRKNPRDCEGSQIFQRSSVTLREGGLLPEPQEQRRP